MKVAVIGSGAMGCLFGGRLALSGVDVAMIDARRETVEKIARDGIILHSGEETVNAKVRAGFASDFSGTFDLIMIFTKTTTSERALDGARHLIGPSTYLMSLQNGLGNDRVLEGFVPSDRVLVGVTTYPSDLLGDGEIASSGGGFVKFYTASLKPSAMVDEVESMLTGAGFDCTADPAVYSSIWEKLAFNAALNALCCICNVPCGGIAKTEEGIALSRAITRETAMVAASYGVDVDLDAINERVEKSYVVHKEHYPSMAQDMQHRRRTEVDFINGAIVRYAREKGLEVPHVETTWAIIKTIEASWA